MLSVLPPMIKTPQCYLLGVRFRSVSLHGTSKRSQVYRDNPEARIRGEYAGAEWLRQLKIRLTLMLFSHARAATQ